VSSIATKAPTAAAQPNTLMNRLFGTGGEEQPTDNTDTIAQPAENPIANEQQETAAEPLQANDSDQPPIITYQECELMFTTIQWELVNSGFQEGTDDFLNACMERAIAKEELLLLDSFPADTMNGATTEGAAEFLCTKMNKAKGMDRSCGPFVEALPPRPTATVLSTPSSQVFPDFLSATQPTITSPPEPVQEEPLSTSAPVRTTPSMLEETFGSEQQPPDNTDNIDQATEAPMATVTEEPITNEQQESNQHTIPTIVTYNECTVMYTTIKAELEDAGYQEETDDFQNACMERAMAKEKLILLGSVPDEMMNGATTEGAAEFLCTKMNKGKGMDRACDPFIDALATPLSDPEELQEQLEVLPITVLPVSETPQEEQKPEPEPEPEKPPKPLRVRKATTPPINIDDGDTLSSAEENTSMKEEEENGKVFYFLIGGSALLFIFFAIIAVCYFTKRKKSQKEEKQATTEFNKGSTTSPEQQPDLLIPL